MTMAMWFVLFGLVSIAFGILIGIWIGGCFPQITDFLFPVEEDDEEEEANIVMTTYHEE